jgi:NADPH-dependent curcumin reductase CurA
MKTRQVIVKDLPIGTLNAKHFEMRNVELSTPQDGELLVRTILMSIDAANRAWMQGATYRAPILAGEPMHTYALAEVVESKSAKFNAGDVVAVESFWADYAVVAAKGALKLPKVPTLSHLMSVFGIAGKTAFHGLISVGRPVPGETIVVSAAAGSVGVYVGQIAKAIGCRVVGIAGGAEKCCWVVGELGFDACVDYHDPAWHKALKAACPDGIDIYFDNVGGSILETVLFRMNEKGRIVCCGAVSQYDGSTPSGPRNLPGLIVVKRLRMEGFIVMDYADDDAKALRALQNWVTSGTIKVPEDIVNGLENAPAALIGLLADDNRGKRMVRVGADPS